VSQGLGRFKPYPEYKDSGVKWLGEIPVHWEVKRLKYVAPARTRKMETKLDEAIYVGLEHVESWTGRLLLDNQPENVDSTVLAFKAGDVLFGKLRPYLAKAARPDFDGVCTSEILALRPVPGVSQSYAMYCLLNPPYISCINSLTYGTKMPRVSPEQIGCSFIPLLPIAEQQAIAAFLDKETAKIDALIAKKERLIELLQEKRSALITHAVTKGLNPAAPMKDSGDEFLGATPSHWLCVPLSRVTLSRCDGPFGSGLKSEHYRSSGVRVVRLQNIGTGEFVDTDHAYIEETHARELGNHSVLADDVLVAGLGDDSHPVGRACVAPPGIHTAMVKADCFRFRVDRRLVFPHFVARQLTATAVMAAGSLATGATRARMNLTATSQWRLALPPIDEQAVIAKFVDAADAQCSAILDVIKRGINHLNEYRTALVSAAVTGKIDIRTEVA
jgi:type I restriction enzyme S subunit